MTRPPVPFDPNEHRPTSDLDRMEWRIYIDAEWIIARDGKRCRYTIGPGHRQCGRATVAYFARGFSRRLWAYCERHLYGRWLEYVGGAERVVDYRLKHVRDPEGVLFVERVK